MLDCVAVEDKSKSQGFVAGNFDLSHSSSRKQVLVAGDGARDSVLVGSLDLSNFPTLSEAQKGVENGNGNGSGDGAVSNLNFLDQSLKFFPPVEKNDKFLVQPPLDVLLNGAKQWSNALIGNFLGKSPTISVFQRTADRLWGREGWIKLWHVPLELYSQTGLGYIACALGKPLYTDRGTLAKQSLEFAKICVELDAKFVLLESVTVDLGMGRTVDISVDVAKEVDAVKVVGSSSNDVGVAVVGSFGVGSGSGQLASSNRFDDLCSVAEGQEAPVVSPRKQRIAAGGVADLMEQLKPKGKVGQKKRGKGVQKSLNVETRVRIENVGAIVASKFRGWNFINNYGDASGGRIWILSRNSWQVDIIRSSAQVVHCLLRQGDVSFFLSVVYGSNGREERRELWRTLVDVKRSVGDCPWALAGDFNITFSPQESSDYNGSQRITGAMQEFLDCKDELDVVDHSYTGSLFTWCNCREEGLLSRKLDRILVNQSWFTKFPSALVVFRLPDCSDHSLLRYMF
ncbi:hypothetical protein V6N13_129488 [Hibiscus sabdariffa]